LQNPTGVAVPSTPGQYTYTVTATGPNGITCTDTTIVTVNTRPNIGADTAIIRCAGTAINLTSLYNTATLTPVWTLNGVVVANPTAVTVSGIYRLIASNAVGCRDTAFANITLSTVSADVSAAEIICTQTGRITVFNVTGIPPYQFSISSNPGVFQTSNQFVAPAGTYTITTRDSLGCITTDVVTVTVSPLFTASAGPDISIFSGDEAQIFGSSSVPASSILWTPATNLSSATTINTIAKPTSTTLYRLTATNSVGCVATDDVLITIIPYCVKVKNAFTPNGDGNNDLWQVYDDFGCLRNITVQVFNRYGNKVFESRDYRNNWNGTYSGKPVPDATYYAVLNFTLITGRVVTVKTDITILR
jgi:gliding motility-associated-like protein